MRGTEDFSSPELLTGIQLYEECEALEELDGHTRDVVAADAWSVGAILFNAATGMTTAQSYIHAVGNRLIVHLLGGLRNRRYRERHILTMPLRLWHLPC